MKLFLRYSDILHIFIAISFLAVGTIFSLYLIPSELMFIEAYSHLLEFEIPDRTIFIFVSINLIRVVLFLLNGILLLSKNSSVRKFIFIGLLAEALGIISNYLFINKEFSILWHILNISPIFLALISFFLLIKNPISSNNWVSKNPSFESFNLGDTLSKIRNDFYNPFGVLVVKKFSSINYKLIFFFFFLILIIAITINKFKNEIMAEIQYFFTKTNFLQTSGFDKHLNKFPNLKKKLILQENSPEKNQEIDKKKQTIEKEFTNTVYTNRILKKSTNSYELAHTFMTRKQYSEALKEFEKSLHSSNQTYTKMLSHYFMAKIHEQQYGNKKMALKHWTLLKNMKNIKLEKNQTDFSKQAIKQVKRLKSDLKKEVK